MTLELYNYPSDEKQKITLLTVFKKDVLPWLFSSLLALGIFYGVNLLLVDASNDVDMVNASSYLLSYAIVFYFALIVGACILAQRSINVWTWVLSGILIVFFASPNSWTIATIFWPNSILPALSVMNGMLALGKIIEYIHYRYFMKLEYPKLSVSSLVLYVLLVLQALFLNTPYFSGIIN